MDSQKPRNSGRVSVRLSNGYILPEGKITPNALFVGGIDMNVNENEIGEFFAGYGCVKEVKIITYRGGICKGYGFIYFSEDVNIQSIIEQQISFKGRKLKLGPAIMKERSARSLPSRLIGPAPRMSAPQYFYCNCCSPVGGAITQPPPIFSAGSPYTQPYTFSNYGGVMIPQVPVNYTQNPYAYQTTYSSPPPNTQYSTPQWTADDRTRHVNQNFVDCGVQTMLTVL